jgi:hypothetical protein
MPLSAWPVCLLTGRSSLRAYLLTRHDAARLSFASEEEDEHFWHPNDGTVSLASQFHPHRCRWNSPRRFLRNGHHAAHNESGSSLCMHTHLHLDGDRFVPIAPGAPPCFDDDHNAASTQKCDVADKVPLSRERWHAFHLNGVSHADIVPFAASAHLQRAFYHHLFSQLHLLDNEAAHSVPN